MKTADINVGAKIRAYRERNGVTLKQLSQLTGIAASNLSSIELNKSSPTLNTLLKIATAFGVKAGTFLDGVLYRKAVLCPVEEGQVVASRHQAISELLLTGGVTMNRMDANIVTADPLASFTLSTSPGADILVYCLEGTLSVQVDDDSFAVQSGDCLYLLPEASPILRTGTGSGAKILVVEATDAS